MEHLENKAFLMVDEGEMVGFWTWAVGAWEGAERLPRGERRGEEKDGLVLFITLYLWLTRLFGNTSSLPSISMPYLVAIL